MAKVYVLFEKLTGELRGILEEEDLPVFDTCREINDYHIVRMKQKELTEALGNRDQGSYMPIYYDDVIIFAHEECTFFEMIQTNIEVYHQMFPLKINTLLHSLQLSQEESCILRVSLGQMLNNLTNFVDPNYVGDETYEEMINARNAMVSVLKYFDLKGGFR